MRSKRISRHTHTHTKLEKKFNNISKRKVVVQWVTGRKAATLHISRMHFFSHTLIYVVCSCYLMPSKHEKQCHVVLDTQFWTLLHSVQVNLCRKLLFLHQLTHNMTTDCSLNYKFNTSKFQAQTWGEHVVYRNCF